MGLLLPNVTFLAQSWILPLSLQQVRPSWVWVECRLMLLSSAFWVQISRILPLILQQVRQSKVWGECWLLLLSSAFWVQISSILPLSLQQVRQSRVWGECRLLLLPMATFLAYLMHESSCRWWELGDSICWCNHDAIFYMMMQSWCKRWVVLVGR